MGITLLSGVYTHFHVAGNDFWSLLYYGRHISWDQKASLYNGFYPIGYAFLIGQLPFGYAIQLSYFMNALFAGFFVASICSLVYTSRSIPAILLAFAVSVSLPSIYIYSNTVGPDIGAAALTAFAIYLLWKAPLTINSQSDSTVNAILAGCALGLAVLCRNHTIVSSAIILAVYYSIFGFRPHRGSLTTIASFLIVLSIQALANLLSGHGIFETAQNFNIYKFLKGVDWTYPPSPADIDKFSLFEVIRKNPQRILSTYLPWFRYFVSFAWPGVLCFLIAARGSRVSKYGLFAAVVTILYAIPVSLGDSLRGVVTIMSLFLSSLALSAGLLIERLKLLVKQIKWMPNLVAPMILALSLYPISLWVISDWSFLRENRAEHKVFTGIEQVLLARGMTSPEQVYADRYDFYFPNSPPYLPRQIGSFFYDWIWGYDHEYPPLPNESWEAFAKACSEQNVRFLVLSPNSGYRGDFFTRIYEGELDLKTLGLSFIAQRGKMRIYSFL
jgi:hypothetical protein